MKAILVSILYGQKRQNERIEFGFDENGFYLSNHFDSDKTIQHFPFQKKQTFAEITQYYYTHPTIFNTAKNLFPDWDEISIGQWSFYGFNLNVEDNDEINRIEFGLFHEWETSNYSFETKSIPKKDITLNIFMGDNIIFCHSILL